MPASKPVVVEVSFFDGSRERLTFTLTDTGQVDVVRGDAGWLDFDQTLKAPDGRQVTRSAPMEWALALQSAYQDSDLAVWVSSGPGRRPASPRGPLGRMSQTGRRVVIAALACVLLAGTALGALRAAGIGPHRILNGIGSVVGFASAQGCAGGGCTHDGPPPPLGPPPDVRLAASRGAAELAGSDTSSGVSRDPETGLWGAHTKPAWWQSALALRAIVLYLQATRNTDPYYQRVIMTTFEHNVRKPGTHMPLNFGNQFLDDTGWWGLTWLDASRYEASVRHDYTLASRFLEIAEWDANYIATRARTCGGGLAWRLGAPPDTITTAEFVALVAQLYSVRHQAGHFHNDAKASLWLADAVTTLNWLEASGLINPTTGVVIDGMDKSCHKVGGPLTYSEGEIAAALTDLGLALHENSYFREANAFLRYTMNPRHGMMDHGVLQEACEGMRSQCVSIEDFNVSVFKGIFVQAVAGYEKATGDTSYQPFLRRQVQAIVHNSVSDGEGHRTSCQTPHDCQFGFYWARRIDPAKAPVPVTVATQISALNALTADLNF